nr:NAD(P)-dependent oxidoreductase [uncultured Sediminibacterium sp.]
MKKRKILITGSSGLVGSAISTVLEHDFDVLNIIRSLRNVKSDKFMCYELDLTKHRLSECIKEFKPEYLIHCAARIPTNSFPDSIDLYNHNWCIDQNVFDDNLKKLGIKLIYFSTTSVYGNLLSDTSITEDSQLNYASFYSRQKIEAEQEIQNRFPESWIFRVNAPYGPNYKHKTVLTSFLESSLRSEQLLLYGDGKRMQDFTFTLDIAKLIKNIITSDNKNYGIFNLSTGSPISMKNLADLIITVTSSSSHVGFTGVVDPQENYKANYSIKRAKDLLGWRPETQLKDGILELVNYYKYK